jgi:hypothetical protein
MGQLAQEKGFLHPGDCAMEYIENREEKKKEKKEEEKEEGKNTEAKGRERRQDIIESKEGR